MLLFNAAPAGGALVTVTPDGTGDYLTIQAAMAAVSSGDTISLAAGTFSGPGNRDIDFMGRNALLLGAGMDSTVIDCETAGRAFLFMSGEDSTCTVKGLTVTRGRSSTNGGAVTIEGSNPTFLDCRFSESEARGNGGAIHAQGSRATFYACRFEGNVAHPQQAGFGGASYLDGSLVTFTDCSFVENRCGAQGAGSAIYAGASTCRLHTCSFELNGGFGESGACVYLSNDPNTAVIAVGSSFTDNQARNGGAIAGFLGTQSLVDSCLFASNTAADDGGALNVSGAGHLIRHCTFVDNTARFDPTLEGWGGGVNASGSLTISACTFERNAAGLGGGIYGVDASLQSCTFVGNRAYQGDACYSTRMSVENCTIRDHPLTGGDVNHATIYAAPGETVLRDCVLLRNRQRAVFCVEGSVAAIRTTVGWNTSGGFYLKFNSSLLLANTIVAFGHDAVEGSTDASVAAVCSDIYGNVSDWAGLLTPLADVNGNFSADPHFCGGEDTDGSLNILSPCLPGNHPDGATCGIIGARDLGCNPVTYFVEPDGTGDFPTIIEAIAAAAQADTIELGDGLFPPIGNSGIDIGDKHVVVRSRSRDASVCTIDCGGDNYGFSLGGVVSPTAIEDVTIENGAPAIIVASGPKSLRRLILRNNAGGIFLNSASASIEDCIFYSNSADDGGAVTVSESGAWITRCRFLGNSATGTSGTGAGGAVYLANASPQISECSFFGNSARDFGAAIGGFASDDMPLLVNKCIIAFNDGGGGVQLLAGNFMVQCTDIFGNAGGDWIGAISSFLGVDGNFSADPAFCDTVALVLSPRSPCLPGNHPDGIDCGAIGAVSTPCAPVIVSAEITNEAPYLVMRMRPNPVRSVGNLLFALPETEEVALQVFDVLGRTVSLMRLGLRERGRHHVVWDARNGNGTALPAGVYFLRLSTSTVSRQERVVVIH